jgi:hypothetical protein
MKVRSLRIALHAPVDATGDRRKGERTPEHRVANLDRRLYERQSNRSGDDQ